MKQEITFFVSSLSGGGSERVCVSIAHAIAEQGYNVTILYLYKKKCDATIISNLHSNVQLVHLNSNTALQSIFKVSAYLRAQKIKKIVAFKYELVALLVLLKKVRGISCCIIARNNSNISRKWVGKSDSPIKRLKNYVIKHCFVETDYIVHQSADMRQQFVNVYPGTASKSTFILNPIASQFQNTISIANDVQIHQPYLLCVGRLEAVKDFFRAISVFARIAKQHPNLRLKIIGEGGEYERLLALAGELKVSHLVDFEGYKDPFPYYRNARLTLLTSRYEGCPNVMLESLAVGTPVVAFDFDFGPREVLIDGVNGYLVRYQDMDDLEAKIIRALNTDFDAIAITHTVQHHQSNNVAKQWLEVLNR